MDETNDGLFMPDDAQNDCWRMGDMKESTLDDVRKIKIGWRSRMIHLELEGFSFV